MSLYEQWRELCDQQRTPDQQNLYWGAYFDTEKEAYRKILTGQNNIIEGTVAELADKFEMTKVQAAGFIDGINTSLVTQADVDTLEADSNIKLEIIWEKLYENMLGAKADWLYTLEEWAPILSEERRAEIRKNFNLSRMAVSDKIGRNDPCPCGSGLKYKKCCINK